MPPKRAANRRKGAVDASSPPRRSARMSPGLGSSILPNIPTKQSFAYGSSATPILPHMLAAKPSMNLEEMADSIEDAVQVSRERERSESINSPSLGARSRGMTPIDTGSPRRARRQPTPDEVQLLNSLHEASSATPSTPMRHSFSSGSSPRDSFAQQLYPSIMEREPSPIQAESSLDRLASDNISIVSYNIERDVHDDDLKRTRSNITAPPRRLVGLAFDQSTIQEEEEPSYVSRPPSLAPSRPRSDQSFNEGVPVRTTIPDRTYEESIPEKKSQSPPKARKHRKSPKAESRQESQDQPQPQAKESTLSRLVQLCVAAIAAVALYSLVTQNMGPSYSDGTTPIRFNNSGLDALSNQVVNLGSQVSTLSKDVKSARAEVSRVPAPTTIFQYPNKRQETLKTNFLSIGHGIIIDPYMTSPSAGRQLTWLQEFYLWLAGDKHLRPQPPLAALTPWEDFGECWCSAPRAGMSQIGILLGRRIIPEDIIVEHLPKAATIRPEVAPQEMELWARYRYVGKNAKPNRSGWSSMFRSYPESIAGQDALAPDRKIVRGPVMEALRLTWRGEPDSAFSDDGLLGPDFYRIGKWTYDIHDKTHVQRFPVTAFLDTDELRVDKVVFRVKSNWGGNETCIYRLKLHGKL
ncbi:hypothetical protein BDV19DRAFT_398611 [Aspergillus venezuelensis]